MATPMTADQFVAALKAEGVNVVEHPGWRDHNRAGHGAWGPVNGLIIHHTGGTAPSDGEIVWTGRSDLPGPCAQTYLAKSGAATMTGNGRANHAGGGDPAVLAAVVDEEYIARPPATHKHEGSVGAADGNAHFYGLECSNRGDGKDPWPGVQYDAAVRWASAICRFHQWSDKSAIGHKEWSDWKPDPTFDMVQFRADVAERLARPASWNPNTAPPEDDMPTAKEVAAEVWAFPLNSPTSGKNFSAATFLRYGDDHFARLTAQLGAQTAVLNALAKAMENGGGLTVEQATAAAEAGAKAALAELGDALTD